jgi:hypothetical protein
MYCLYGPALVMRQWGSAASPRRQGGPERRFVTGLACLNALRGIRFQTGASALLAMYRNQVVAEVATQPVASPLDIERGSSQVAAQVLGRGGRDSGRLAYARIRRVAAPAGFSSYANK